METWVLEEACYTLCLTIGGVGLGDTQHWMKMERIGGLVPGLAEIDPPDLSILPGAPAYHVSSEWDTASSKAFLRVWSKRPIEPSATFEVSVTSPSGEEHQYKFAGDGKVAVVVYPDSFRLSAPPRTSGVYSVRWSISTPPFRPADSVSDEFSIP